MAFTHFYTNADTGNNTYAGSTEGSPVTTLTGGDWVSATGVFTKAGADLSAVSVGMFAAVMVDGGTVAAIVGRITAVDDGADTITVSTTAKSGSLGNQTGTATLTVGGVWKGPNGAVGFPFNFVTNALTNASGHFPRINLKNNATYSITAAMTQTNAGPISWQGYTTTAGDGGRAIIDGGTSGASYVLLTQSGSQGHLADLIFQNNGATGSAAGLAYSNPDQLIERCVVNSVRGHGFGQTDASGGCILDECEAYACNQSNTANTGGFNTGSSACVYIRCMSHDNTGSNNLGYRALVRPTYIDCIADSNGSHGWLLTLGNGMGIMKGCDSYNNGGDGVALNNSSASGCVIENCNFIKNGGYGINGVGAGSRYGVIRNCGFGSGSQANTSGTTNSLSAIVESDSITYASGVTPWVDPANGDFRINLAAAKGTGRGAFTQTAASYAGTVAYPDVGAAQHQDAGGGGGSSLFVLLRKRNNKRM